MGTGEATGGFKQQSAILWPIFEDFFSFVFCFQKFNYDVS